MTPDLYAAWLTAGNNLQPVGGWLGSNWLLLVPVVAATAFAAWAIRRAVRDASQRVDNILADFDQPAHETAPGSNSDDLLTCLHILNATNTARKGDQP